MNKLEKNVMHPDMGQMIKKAVKEQKMSVSDFAKAINCSRTNVYSIFGRKTITIDRLEQIIKVLKLNISDFIVMDRRKPNKSVAVIEIERDKLERLLSEYDFAFVKSWQTK